MQSQNAKDPILATGYPPRVDGILIAPEVDFGMAGDQPEPLYILALPSVTV
jgi:hypothetical protein